MFLAFLLISDGFEGRHEADLWSAEHVGHVSHRGLQGAHESGYGSLQLSEHLGDKNFLGGEFREAVNLFGSQ